VPIAGNQEGKIMTDHPNIARIRDGYAAFAKADFAALNDLFAEDVVWHVQGRNQLAGDYRGREAVYGFFGKLMELTQGSFHIDLQAVLADDEHGVALVDQTASRDGRSFRTYNSHIFHLRDGMVTEFWDASTDQYAFDELLG
jgi:ketosteroid isomerase-like protein